MAAVSLIRFVDSFGPGTVDGSGTAALDRAEIGRRARESVADIRQVDSAIDCAGARRQREIHRLHEGAEVRADFEVALKQGKGEPRAVRLDPVELQRAQR